MEMGFNYSKTYEKWRKLLVKSNKIVISYILLMELIMYFVLRHYEYMYISNLGYLVKYLIIPSSINFLTIIVGTILERIAPKTSGRINYIPVIELITICFVIATFHHVYSVTKTIYCVPLLTTIIFADKKMLSRIFYLSSICLVLSTILGSPFVTDYNQSWDIVETIIALVVLTGTYQISKILIKFQLEKNTIIINSYRKQLDMKDLLNKDQKTGLYNHTMFMNKLRESTDKCLNGESPFALAIIDIDDFKKVNDAYGHAKGDFVILKLAEIILNKCSDRQFPARFGGEEFAIIFDERSAKNSYEVVENIREEFEKYIYDFSNSNVTISCGIATWVNPWNAETIFENADHSMYLSKKSGKNKTTIYK